MVSAQSVTKVGNNLTGNQESKSTSQKGAGGPEAVGGIGGDDSWVM